jgi:putative DNA primase/helicase
LRTKDKSESFYRRQILIPMDKCFTGTENTSIKDDYLNRSEVLEYVLWKVLNTDFYELVAPEMCRHLLGEFKEFNDPVREFISDFIDVWVWDVIPWDFLYDLFVSWHKRFNPSGKPEKKSVFKAGFVGIMKDSDEWEIIDGDKKVNVGNKMDEPELLIHQYNLDKWKNRQYTGGDPDKISRTIYEPAQCRGLLRIKTEQKGTINND